MEKLILKRLVCRTYLNAPLTLFVNTTLSLHAVAESQAVAPLNVHPLPKWETHRPGLAIENSSAIWMPASRGLLWKSLFSRSRDVQTLGQVASSCSQGCGRVRISYIVNELPFSFLLLCAEVLLPHVYRTCQACQTCAAICLYSVAVWRNVSSGRLDHFDCLLC